MRGVCVCVSYIAWQTGVCVVKLILSLSLSSSVSLTVCLNHWKHSLFFFGFPSVCKILNEVYLKNIIIESKLYYELCYDSIQLRKLNLLYLVWNGRSNQTETGMERLANRRPKNNAKANIDDPPHLFVRLTCKMEWIFNRFHAALINTQTHTTIVTYNLCGWITTNPIHS